MIMFLLNFLMFYCISVAKTEESIADIELLGDCPLSIFDLTFSSDTSDSVQLILVVRNVTEKFHIYNISKASSILKDAEFIKEYKTVLYIHGFYDKPGSGSISTSTVVETYRKKGGYNILLLDASSRIGLPYFRGARAARYIGIRLGSILSYFYRSGFDIKTLDVVGHSLGAHIAGYIGKSFYRETRKLLPRIFGIDPSGPCFKSTSSVNRLDKDDAEYVQVIHTGGIGFGMMTPIGHADFYINGGRKQPSTYSPACYVVCSHVRSVYIWKYAVLHPKKFVGVECKDMEEVGEDSCFERGRLKSVIGAAADPKVKGLFYVRTLDREPFYMKINI